MRGGKRQGAGRKRGSTVKKTDVVKARLKQVVESGGELPLDFLLRVMRAEPPVQGPKEEVLSFIARYKRWDEDRLEAAKHAAPYCHAKLATIEHTGKDGEPIKYDVTFTFVEAKK